jgi:hypothetical protein
MSLTKALFWAIVACLPVYALAASVPDCPAGPFETDPDAIALSFLFEPSDSDILKVTENDGNKTPEIGRIRAGVLWHSAGGLGSYGSEGWLAYDAERHLILSFGMETRRYATQYAELGDGSVIPPQGDVVRPDGSVTYVMNFARATPDQARQFACLANTLANRYAALQAAHPPLPSKSDPQREPGGLMQVTVSAYVPHRCDDLAGSDEFVQTFSLWKDAQWFLGVCDATGAGLRSQLSGLVGSALQDAHREGSGKRRARVAPPKGVGPIIDPYAGRKFNFVH